MVSKARELLPEPDNPVTTVSVLRGMRTLISWRLCWRAPRTEMCVMAILGKERRFPVRLLWGVTVVHSLEVFYLSIESRVNEGTFLRESQRCQSARPSQAQSKSLFYVVLYPRVPRLKAD